MRAARGWWRRRAPISPRNGRINAAIGAACGLCALLDIRLGLESLGRWYPGYFAVVLIGWGLLAVRFGHDAELARPLRLAGDALGWAGMVGFAAIGLLLDPPEYPALITLIGFTAAVAGIAMVGRRAGPFPEPSPGTRRGSNDGGSAIGG